MLPHPLFNFIKLQIHAKINFIYANIILLIDIMIIMNMIISTEVLIGMIITH